MKPQSIQVKQTKKPQVVQRNCRTGTNEDGPTKCVPWYFLFWVKKGVNTNRSFPWKIHKSYLLDGFPEVSSNNSLLSVFSLTWGIFTSCIPSICFHSCVRVSCHRKISTSVSCISVMGFIRLLYKQDNSMRAFWQRKSTPCSQNVLNRVSKKHKGLVSSISYYRIYTLQTVIFYYLLIKIDLNHIWSSPELWTSVITKNK